MLTPDVALSRLKQGFDSTYSPSQALGRDPGPGAVEYLLSTGQDAGSILLGFTQSSEFIARSQAAIDAFKLDLANGLHPTGPLAPSPLAVTLTSDHDLGGVDEGSTVTFTLHSTNAADFGKTFSYTISGVSAADIVGGSLTGSVTLDAQGTATVARTLVADHTTEGPETLTLAVAGLTDSVTVTDVNEAPVITSNGGGDTAAVSIAENTTAVTTVTATDPDVGQTLSYSIIGGADASKFTIGATTGALSFVTAPNFELPTDAGGNNVYDVIVQVSDGHGGIDTQAIAVTVTDVFENTAPIITSNGGGDTAAVSIAENTTAVTTVTATDPDVGQTLSYSIIGGADASKFTIGSSTGALSFVTAPNFELPTDAGGNNVYDVIVQVSDGHGGIDTQAIAVTVTDVNEAPVITSNGGRRHGGGIHCREHHCGHHCDGDRPGRRANAELLDHWWRGREQIHHRLFDRRTIVRHRTEL